MIRVTFNTLRAFFNLEQWFIRWYNLDTPLAMNAKHRQAVQIMSNYPVNGGESQ
jgi:hypothetical protein